MERVRSRTGLLLQQRLRLHIGKRLTIEAVDFSSEPGILQNVDRTFIKVSGQFFVPTTLNQITLLDIPTKPTLFNITIRTTFRGTFNASFIQLGSDFIELVEKNNKTSDRFLIPLNKVISVERM